jgi:hypothetical protein
MLCPHCNKQVNGSHIPIENAKTNAENYGSSTFYFECPKCKKRFGVVISRLIKVQKPFQVHCEHELSYG